MFIQRRRLIYNPNTGKFQEINTEIGKDMFWKDTQPHPEAPKDKEREESTEEYYD